MLCYWHNNVVKHGVIDTCKQLQQSGISESAKGTIGKLHEWLKHTFTTICCGCKGLFLSYAEASQGIAVNLSNSFALCVNSNEIRCLYCVNSNGNEKNGVGWRDTTYTHKQLQWIGTSILWENRQRIVCKWIVNALRDIRTWHRWARASAFHYKVIANCMNCGHWATEMAW